LYSPLILIRICFTSRHPHIIPGKVDPSLLDPNYLSRAQFPNSPWHVFLGSWQDALGNTPLFHIDVHGCHNRKDVKAQRLELGISPMEAHLDDAVLTGALKKTLADKLEAALRPFGFGVDRDPALSGLWGGDRHTLSHQSVLRRVPAVQFEIPRTLRAALVTNDALFAAFADAIADTYRLVVVPAATRK
jgi:hypothetical protein